MLVEGVRNRERRESNDSFANDGAFVTVCSLRDFLSGWNTDTGT